MINHDEAQTLISARQDQRLDPMVERALLSHLATCAECREFASLVDHLTYGLRSLPYSPPSERVRQGVFAEIERGRGPMAKISSIGDGKFMPALSTIAAIALVALLGWFVYARVLPPEEPGDDGNNGIASRPTEVVDDSTPRNGAFRLNGTERPTVRPSETPSPTATSTSEPQPTATERPAPTATDEPQPTATERPAPTATNQPQPTETAEPQPTATELTATDVAEPTSTESPERTQTNAPEPTASSEPTSEPDPTQTEEPTIPPGRIEGVEGTTTPIETISPDADTTSGSRSSVAPAATECDTDPAAGVIEPLEGSGADPCAEATQAPTGTGGDNQRTANATPPPTETVSATTPESQESLEGASTEYEHQSLEGDPSGRFILSDGRLIFGDTPDAAPTTTTDGWSIQANGADVNVCAGNECLSATPAGEQPAGSMTSVAATADGGLVYATVSDAGVTYHLVYVSDGAISSDEVILQGTAAAAPVGPAYSDGETIVVPTDSGWVVIADGSAYEVAGPGGNPTLVRIGTSDSGTPPIGYVVNGRLIVAPLNDPGTPIVDIPFSGVDFDFAPGSTQIAVSTGSSIEIYDMSGNLVQQFEGSDSATGTVIWLRSGLIWYSPDSGTIYQLPDTANNP